MLAIPESGVEEVDAFACHFSFPQARLVFCLPVLGADAPAGKAGHLLAIPESGVEKIDAFACHRLTSQVVIRSPVSESFESFSWIP